MECSSVRIYDDSFTNIFPHDFNLANPNASTRLICTLLLFVVKKNKAVIHRICYFTQVGRKDGQNKVQKSNITQG